MNGTDLRFFYAITESPPAFACHKTESHTIEGRITYNGCNVRTIGMDANSGIFTVKVSILDYFSVVELKDVLIGGLPASNIYCEIVKFRPRIGKMVHELNLR